MNVNKEKCKHVGEVLKGINIRPEFYKREFLSFNNARETKLLVYLFSAAICHQTHSLYHPGLNLWGWDYLEYGFLKMVSENSPLLSPDYLATEPESSISNELLAAFSVDGNPGNSTLDRIEERTSMLVELSKHLKAYYNSSAVDFIDQSDGFLVSNEKGIYKTLGEFMAFSDPQKKKITFLLKLAQDAGIITIKDRSNIIPIMDYHMQRVLLRLGCVDFQNKEYFNQLRRKTPLFSDEPIRSACIQAAKIIAEVSGHGIMKMNDFFWPLGRSCCNTTTICHDHVCRKSPCTFQLMADIQSHSNCIFEKICKGNASDEFRELWEPVIKTHYY